MNAKPDLRNRNNQALSESESGSLLRDSIQSLIDNPHQPTPPVRVDLLDVRYPALVPHADEPEILDIETAREREHASKASFMELSAKWLAEATATCLDENGNTVPDQQRRDAAGRAPLQLRRVTTGVGKTQTNIETIGPSDLPTVIVTPLVAESERYAAESVNTCRRRPRSGDCPGEANLCHMMAGNITVGRRIIPIKGITSPCGGNVMTDGPEHEHAAHKNCGNCPTGALHAISNPNSRLSMWEKEKLQEKLDSLYDQET